MNHEIDCDSSFGQQPQSAWRCEGCGLHNTPWRDFNTREVQKKQRHDVGQWEEGPRNRPFVMRRSNGTIDLRWDDIRLLLGSNELLNLVMGKAIETLQQVVNLPTKRSAALKTIQRTNTHFDFLGQRDDVMLV